ncbi:hypothetical protein GMDG_02527 [Pseudogymnoascus destructans 20631-21]|uniref:Uncharacterized protein n=1 Tax=Pseudogymnoascus destructans (strain ATCC MYA-4855 / 20631-21) TaxID=658429 RepID=L8G2N5_PSED2|nr:hypothetical protein GMDG_02527 [Pseudogymnoascus destructans 20631-21]
MELFKVLVLDVEVPFHTKLYIRVLIAAYARSPLTPRLTLEDNAGGGDSDTTDVDSDVEDHPPEYYLHQEDDGDSDDEIQDYRDSTLRLISGSRVYPVYTDKIGLSSQSNSLGIYWRSHLTTK